MKDCQPGYGHFVVNLPARRLRKFFSFCAYIAFTFELTASDCVWMVPGTYVLD